MDMNAPSPPRCAKCSVAETVLLPDVSRIANVWYFGCPRCGELVILDKAVAAPASRLTR